MLFTRVVTAAALIAGLIAALYLLERTALQWVAGGIVALAAYEWSRLSGVHAIWMNAAYAAVCLALHSLIASSPELIGPSLWAAAVFWVAIAPSWMSRGFLPGPRGLLPWVGFVVIVPAGVAMADLSPRLVLVLIGVTAVADTAAYFCGRAFGRRKLAPSISPGKTWEGVAGGTVACLIYATICAMWMPEFASRVVGAGWGVFLAGVAILCAASVLGDLFESALKRRAGQKDSGRLLPGHGGVLDRIDSATASLPLGLLMLRSAGIA